MSSQALKPRLSGKPIVSAPASLRSARLPVRVRAEEESTSVTKVGVGASCSYKVALYTVLG